MSEEEIAKNFSKLRRMVIERGSDELKELESQLLRSYVNKKNEELTCYKNEIKERDRERQKEYGALISNLDYLEMEEKNLKLMAQKNKEDKLMQVNKSQIEAKALASLEEKCLEIVVNAALLPDENKIKENKLRVEAQKEKEKKKINEMNIRQLQHKTYSDLQDKLFSTEQYRAAEVTEEIKDLRKAVETEQRLHASMVEDRRKLSTILELEQQSQLKKELEDLRQSVDILELRETEEKRYNELKRSEELTKKIQNECIAQQLREKIRNAERMKRQDEEYFSILAEVQKMEVNLEALSKEARRRKLMRWREEVERIKEAREREKEKRMEQMKQENEAAKEHTIVSGDLALAEEQNILLQFAPHLLPHFTPQLMERLHNIPNIP